MYLYFSSRVSFQQIENLRMIPQFLNTAPDNIFPGRIYNGELVGMH
jgi:hypothetical protein